MTDRIMGRGRYILICLSIMGGLLTSPLAVAVTNVTVKVTVVAALACVINGNQPVQVDFGQMVRIDKIDGSYALTEINDGITCQNNANNALKLKISALTTSFDAKAIKTDQAALGIALYNGNTRISPNEWINFTWPNKPLLKVAPVKQSNASLKAGAFSGSATLTLDYQ